MTHAIAHPVTIEQRLQDDALFVLEISGLEAAALLDAIEAHYDVGIAEHDALRLVEFVDELAIDLEDRHDLEAITSRWEVV